MGVVHHGKDRPVLCGFGKQAERAQEGEEPIALALRLPQRGAQRPSLPGRQGLQAGAQRPQQPLQRGEGEWRLGLHALCAQDPEVGRGPEGVRQQRRLSGPRHPADHEGAARRAPRGLDQGGDRRAFRVPTDQHGTDRTGMPPRRTGDPTERPSAASRRRVHDAVAPGGPAPDR